MSGSLLLTGYYITEQSWFFLFNVGLDVYLQIAGQQWTRPNIDWNRDIAFEIASTQSSQKYANFNYQQVTDGNLPFSFFSVFTDANHLTLTLEQKSGQSGDANQAYLWELPN